MLYVALKFDLVGYHRWPEAPERYKYLASPHRHLFTFDVEIEEGGSREIEINDAASILKRSLWLVYGRGQPLAFEFDGCDFRSQSCEQLAVQVLGCVLSKWSNVQYVKVVVREDGLQGGGVSWKAE